MNKIWVMVFLVWMIFLSGKLEPWTKTPGIIQAVHLKNLLTQKRQELANLDARSTQLASEENLMKSNIQTQEKEIRRVLGYAAANDLLFEFKGP